MPPYRFLVTGIPLDMSPERFYDCLRAYTTVSTSSPGDAEEVSQEKGLVYNALLLRVPAASPSGQALSVGSAENPEWRSVGAALVDFVSKQAADAVVTAFREDAGASFLACTGAASPWLAVAVGDDAAPRGAQVARRSEMCWEALGPVEPAAGSSAAALRGTHEAAREGGRRAYDTTRRHVANGSVTLGEARRTGLDHGRRPRDARKEGEDNPSPLSCPFAETCPRASISGEANAAEVCHREDSEDDCAELCLCSDALPHLVGPLWHQAVAPVDDTPTKSMATLTWSPISAESVLFTLWVEHLRRSLLLPGILHALRRISDTCVVVSTDVRTARALLSGSSDPENTEGATLTTYLSPEVVAQAARVRARAGQSCTGERATRGEAQEDVALPSRDTPRMCWHVSRDVPQPMVIGDCLNGSEEAVHWQSSSYREGTSPGMGEEAHTVVETEACGPPAIREAALADVLAAMARTLEKTGGRAAAFVDHYGNVIFP